MDQNRQLKLYKSTKGRNFYLNSFKSYETNTNGVYLLDFAMSIRRPHSNPIETFRVYRAFCADHFGNKTFPVRACFSKNTGQILFRLFLHFLQKIKSIFFKKIDDNWSLVVRILKPITYSDSSWKTASDSIETKNIFLTF